MKMTKTIYLFLIFVFLNACSTSDLKKVEKPNIVWLVTEDNSTHYMNLYNAGGANMPTISALAEDGIIFENVFSNAPVCSVARSTIITGTYAPRIGTQYHRKMKMVKLPKTIKPLPVYLSENGYYTTNNAKEDYNFIKEGKVWDESSKNASYKNRAEGQPFFHVQNYHNTHEGSLHFNKEQLIDGLELNNLDSIKPFPYHPDTPTFRYTQSLYYKHHNDVDKEIGKFVKELENDGLMENTIIFYYSDHGGVLPRSKGYLYETGLNVPLVVYIPEKWKHLNPFENGTRTPTFVDFVDLLPTVLSIAGIKIPEFLDGNPFLGKDLKKVNLEKQDITFGYADRFDEKYDFVRSVRKGKYKYIRNFQPFNVDGLYNFYRYEMLAYKEWYRLYNQGKLNNIQSQFFKTKSSEALYNISNDPYEIQNLAEDVNQQKKLEEMRGELENHLDLTNDLSFLPEPYFVANGLEDVEDFSKNHKKLIKRLRNISNLVFYDYEDVSKKIQNALNDPNPWVRYWGLIICSSFGIEAIENLNKINYLFEKDLENLVKIRAAEYLLLNGQKINNEKIKNLLKSAKTETEANLMLNTLALLKTKNPSYKLELSKDVFPENWLPPIRNENALVNRRMNYLTNNE